MWPFIIIPCPLVLYSVDIFSSEISHMWHCCFVASQKCLQLSTCHKVYINTSFWLMDDGCVTPMRLSCCFNFSCCFYKTYWISRMCSPSSFNILMIRAHSFPRAAEFRAEPRNFAVATEFPCFRGISRNYT